MEKYITDWSLAPSGAASESATSPARGAREEEQVTAAGAGTYSRDGSSGTAGPLAGPTARETSALTRVLTELSPVSTQMAQRRTGLPAGGPERESG